MDEKCFHCGDKVIGKPVLFDEKKFCCTGCSTVYQILSDNGLNNFYELNEGSGIKPNMEAKKQYKPLDVPEIFDDFVSFKNDSIYVVTLFLPAIHCSSCIYLLENLNKIEPRILASEANFTGRTLELKIKHGMLLSEVATLLDSIGYKPELRPDRQLNASTKYDKKLLLKLGVAGFAFGSVMLWTFPEYLGLDESFEPFRNLSAYLSLIVAIPVLFFSAWGYIQSAYTAIKTKQLNLDIPIAIGILVLFIKSASSILMLEGPSYMDSFSGFVFFLLIGKWFQSKTYRNMAFDNDPKAYFPLGIHRNKDGKEEIISIDNLVEGDEVVIFNEEIIPCDIELFDNKAVINTSFITGEAELVNIKKGERIYAGSKLIGSAIKGKVLRTTDRSKFASIWNNSNKEKPNSLALNRENKLSRYFLIIVFTISLFGAVVWAFIDPTEIVDIVTAVLVVACPCALALSFPFVYGNAMRKFGKNGLYFKNTFEIEKLANIDHVIFDKTGTLTKDKTEGVVFDAALSDEMINLTYAATVQSIHPYSKSIASWLRDSVTEGLVVTSFNEVPGAGVEAVFENGKSIKVGSAEFVKSEAKNIPGSYLMIDDELIGYFSFQSQLRMGIKETLNEFVTNGIKISLLSGDNDKDAALFGGIQEFDMHFNQTPAQKKAFVENCQNKGQKVAFVGDGLNDSAALNTADLGISVADDVFRFTPSCDAIIDGNKVSYLPSFFNFGRYTGKALNTCMVFSILYNSIGMTFALMGYVTPLFAAILMPLSSISIVFLSTALIALPKVKS